MYVDYVFDIFLLSRCLVLFYIMSRVAYNVLVI